MENAVVTNVIEEKKVHHDVSVQSTIEAVVEVKEKENSNIVIKKENVPKKLLQDEKLKETKFTAELNKSLHNITPEAKINILFNKCIEIAKENFRYESTIKQNDRRVEIYVKEKDYMQQELNKTLLAKSKLESLCRELQKCNKTIKEESLSKIREEEEKRKATQAKFQKSLNEITTMMNENNDKNKKLRDDNFELSQKFKHILEQYEIREKQVEKVSHQLELGNQLNEARMAKLQMEKSVEKEIMLREKAELLTELEANKKIILELASKEKHLREQLNMYTEKYDDFQTSIQKSNCMFNGYKTKIEQMAKNMNKMEKETISWRTKFEKSNSALLDLISEKQIRDEHITKTAKQLFYLQKLCRTLQSERTVILQALKENNIECPPMPEVPPPEPIEIPTITDRSKEKNEKIELMEKNCSDLKQNLLQLQTQLNAMTNEKLANEKEVANASNGPSTNNKKNKNKSKKNKNKAGKQNKQEEVVAETADKVENEENSPNNDDSIAQASTLPPTHVNDEIVDVNVTDVQITKLEDTSTSVHIDDSSSVSDDSLSEISVIEVEPEQSNEKISENLVSSIEVSSIEVSSTESQLLTNTTTNDGSDGN